MGFGKIYRTVSSISNLGFVHTSSKNPNYYFFIYLVSFPFSLLPFQSCLNNLKLIGTLFQNSEFMKTFLTKIKDVNLEMHLNTLFYSMFSYSDSYDLDSYEV